MAVAPVGVIGTISLVSAAKTIPVWVGLAISAGMTALSIGYKFLTAPKGQRGLSQRNWDSNVVSTETSLPVIYGKVRLGISPIFLSSGENVSNVGIDYLFGVGAISHGEIQSIEKVILSNEEKHSVIARNSDGKLAVDEFYTDVAWFDYRLGASSNVKKYSSLAKAFPKWGTNHLGLGVASIYLKLKYDAEKFPAGLPNVSVLVKGTKVHDPRDVNYPNDTAAYSTNPALCSLDYLRNTIYGPGATSDEIDLPSFVTVANYCDQLFSSSTIDPPSSISAKLLDTKTVLYTGKSQEYSYAYAYGTLSSNDESNFATWEMLGYLSAPVLCTVTNSYGAVTLSNILTSNDYARVIFRKQLGTTDTYRYIGVIDAGSDITVFEDNISETDLALAEIWAYTLFGAAAPTTVITATFRDFTESKLDASSYYRYKIVYETASGATHTEPSNASNIVKTKSNKKAIKVSFPISEDALVTRRVIYRTEGFSTAIVPAVGDYKKLYTINENTSESYIDLLIDPSSGDSAPLTNTTTISQLKMFTCNGIVDTSRDVLSNMEEILSSCRGRLFYESGKYSISIRTTSVPEVFELNEDNIIGDWSYRTPGVKDVSNVLKASWINPDQNWQNEFVIEPHSAKNNLYLGDDFGFKILKEIDLPFTTEQRIAKQIAQIVRKESRQALSVSILVKEEALRLRANNVVKVTHSSPGWVKKLFWVDSIKILANATVGITLTEYDATVYNYDIITKDTLGGADTTYPDPLSPPDEVTNVVITEEMYGLTSSEISLGSPATSPMPNWRLKITYTNPASNFWHSSDVYVKKGSVIDDTTLIDSHKYIQMGMIDKNSNQVFYIHPVEPFVTYYIKFVSISTFSPRMLIEDATEWSYTITPARPNTVKSLSAVNKGNDSTAEGEDFVITWAEVTGVGSGTSKNSVGASIPKIAEEISYDIEVYLLKAFVNNGITYLGIPDSVLLDNGEKLNTQLMGTYNIKNNKFTYTKEMNISDINKIFENQGTNINYETYYAHSQRTLAFIVYTKNTWGKRSPGNIIYLHNPAPIMTDINGTTITPTFQTSLSSIEFSWEPPFAEIDLTHFMAKLVGKATTDSGDVVYDSAILDSLLEVPLKTTKRKSSTVYEIGAFVFPKPANGHLYKCIAAVGNGKTASTQPTFNKPSDSNGAHPQTVDGNITWKHYCILRFQKVVASTNSSEDDDMSVTNYTAKFQNLDPKKSFRFKVTPHDAHGAGTSSNRVSATAGTSYDITEDEDIASPEQVGTVTLTINSNNNVIITWPKPSALDNSRDVTKAIIDWRARQGVTGTPVPTLRTATPSGDIPTLGDIDDGNFGGDITKLVIGEKKNIEINLDETEAHASNRYVIKGAKTGYTYFAKVRFENSSKKQGAWSAWAYNATAVSGISDEELPSKWAMYKFLGTVAAVDATHVSVTITAGNGGIGIKKKSSTGSDSIYVNNLSSTSFSGTRFIAYTNGTGKTPGSPAVLSIKTASDMDDNTYTAVAKIIEAPSGKCNVLMMLSDTDFNIAAYGGAFNRVDALILTGTTIQTATSGSRVILDVDGIRAYNGTDQRVQISNDGSGWLGAYSKLHWDTLGNLTVTGVVADSVAAENITAGTITGSTLQTASSGKRFKVSTSNNQAEFYGDRGDGTIVLLSTIGITTSGSDDFIGDFGNLDIQNTKIAVRARAYSKEAINAQSSSGNAINANSATGHGIVAQSSSGFGALLQGNSNGAPLCIAPQSATPSLTNEGQIYYDSDTHMLYCCDGISWKALF